VNYEDRDSPAKRGRAEGQMLDFGVAAGECHTADCVGVKTRLIPFSLTLMPSSANACALHLACDLQCSCISSTTRGNSEGKLKQGVYAQGKAKR